MVTLLPGRRHPQPRLGPAGRRGCRDPLPGDEGAQHRCPEGHLVEGEQSGWRRRSRKTKRELSRTSSRLDGFTAALSPFDTVSLSSPLPVHFAPSRLVSFLSSQAQTVGRGLAQLRCLYAKGRGMDCRNVAKMSENPRNLSKRKSAIRTTTAPAMARRPPSSNKKMDCPL